MVVGRDYVQESMLIQNMIISKVSFIMKKLVGFENGPAMNDD